MVRAGETDLILHLGKKKNVVILLSPHEWADNFGNERIFPCDLRWIQKRLPNLIQNHGCK